MRFYLQPTMAILFAIKDGIKDAKHGQPPYLWAVFTSSERRKELIHSGWKSIGKIIIIALLLDTVYQVMVLKRFYPGEMMIVALCLAVIPYILVRGPINRLVRHRYQPSERTRDKAA